MQDRDFTDIPEAIAGEIGRRAPRPVRSVYAPMLLEHFFISAVVAVLLIRAWLEITGYPQIGGDGLHIAHMLFGGFMMMAAMVIMLAYLGRRARLIAAILGGAGFGTFIDELGKFITSDNDYFFQPTIALIYIIFVLLFLLGERLVRLAQATPGERLAQALDVTTDAVIEQFPATERELALSLFSEADPKSPLTGSTQRALRKIAAQPDPLPNMAERVANRIGRAYAWLTNQRWFLKFVLVISAIGIFFSLVGLVITVAVDPNETEVELATSVAAGPLLLANAIAGALLVIGLLAFRRSVLAALEWFRRAALVSLLMVQPISFYDEQLAAIVGLGLNLALLSALEFAISREVAATDQSPADIIAVTPQ
ncbi:MAG: hypothetical protein M3Z20_07200 [Chloroflexota bacterium]|nr:hypothetical protein [Chloroflexota bacterium]